jgi:hypothetical protein
MLQQHKEDNTAAVHAARPFFPPFHAGAAATHGINTPVPFFAGWVAPSCTSALGCANGLAWSAMVDTRGTSRDCLPSTPAVLLLTSKERRMFAASSMAG